MTAVLVAIFAQQPPQSQQHASPRDVRKKALARSITNATTPGGEAQTQISTCGQVSQEKLVPFVSLEWKGYSIPRVSSPRRLPGISPPPTSENTEVA